MGGGRGEGYCIHYSLRPRILGHRVSVVSNSHAQNVWILAGASFFFEICCVPEGMSLDSLRRVVSGNSGLDEYSQSQSFSDLSTPTEYLGSRSRFEQVFLASPRARVIHGRIDACETYHQGYHLQQFHNQFISIM